MEDGFKGIESSFKDSDKIEGNYEVICGPPHLLKMAENICSSLLTKYRLEEIMDTISKNRDKEIFIIVSRSKPEKVSIIIDKENRYHYSSGDPLFIPLPKKFAVLEPDKNYFEMTLRANIILSVLKADEKELHR